MLAGSRGQPGTLVEAHGCGSGEQMGHLYWEAQYDATLIPVAMATMELVTVPTIRKGHVLVQFIPTRNDDLVLRVQEDSGATTERATFTTKLVDKDEMKIEIEKAGGELGPA